ncbi:MAG: prepilin-type N-terminal cleavage/methylation domain-containing protein, partial [Synergistaceae bacterium]|nr:prepilin-type N-terminal cleavage/methylation domain-containing protein [Synergistaceae bacterium]
MRHTKRKGFTLVEFLIVIAITTTLGTVMTLHSAKTSASQKATNIIHGLVNFKRGVLSWHNDNPDALNSDNKVEELAKYLNTEVITLKDGTKHIKGKNKDEGYFTDVIRNVVSKDGQVVDKWFIEYYSPVVNSDEEVLRGLAQ